MSRKMAFVVMFVAAFFFLFGFSSAEENVWKEEISHDPLTRWSKIYYANFKDAECIVAVKKDETGIILIAGEVLNKRTFIQIAETTKKPFLFEFEYSLIEKRDGMPLPGNRQVFNERFLKFAGQLPDYVRQKFHGCLGVK